MERALIRYSDLRLRE
uniref:Uncharacterized protein n=1 Tax=Arundo donax TaxID=35708 RepID=A0A0A9ARK6_ARUDO